MARKDLGKSLACFQAKIPKKTNFESFFQNNEHPVYEPAKQEDIRRLIFNLHDMNNQPEGPTYFSKIWKLAS